MNRYIFYSCEKYFARCGKHTIHKFTRLQKKCKNIECTIIRRYIIRNAMVKKKKKPLTIMYPTRTYLSYVFIIPQYIIYYGSYLEQIPWDIVRAYT